MSDMKPALRAAAKTGTVTQRHSFPRNRADARVTLSGPEEAWLIVLADSKSRKTGQSHSQGTHRFR